MTTAWRLDVQIAAGSDDHAAAPTWSGDVPYCDTACPHHDGKRCRATGFRPDNLCEPVIAQMGKLLTAGPVRAAPRPDQLTDTELGEIEARLGPSLKLTALVAEVRERRKAP